MRIFSAAEPNTGTAETADRKNCRRVGVSFSYLRDILPILIITGKVAVYRLTLILSLLICPLGAQTPDANTLGWQDRWEHYVERTFSWQRIGMVAAETAFDQTFQLRKCGRPPYCFPHEFGRAVAARTARTTIELGAGALLRQDVRRKPSGLEGFRPRLMFALTHAVLAKGTNGEWRPAYSRFAGTLGGLAVCTAWDGKPMTAGHLGQAFGWSVTNYFQDSLFAEFEPDMKRMAKRVWQTVPKLSRKQSLTTP